MKKIFFIAVAAVIAMMLLLVGYGTFLNYTDEGNIAARLSNRTIKLVGAKAETRVLRGGFTRKDVRMEAENMTDAVSRLEGTVEKIYVQPNSKVVKGQPICHIVNEDIDMKIVQADVNIAKAQTVAARYANSLSRYKRLIGSGAVSMEQYEDIETQYKSALAELETLRLEKQQYEILRDRLTVTAPLDGEVLMLYKKEGAFLQAGTSVALIGNFSRLRFTETISDDDFQSLLPIGKEWELSVEQGDMEKIYSGSYGGSNRGYEQTFGAHIVKVEPPVGQAASLRSISWEVNNSSGLLEPKRYQQVRFQEIVERKVLAVPAKAVDAKRSSVFVWNTDGKLEERKVIFGASDGSFIEVQSGIEPDEIVVISGREGLENGMKAEVSIEGGISDGAQ